jgi:transcriptional regulator with XRE-family HTH domain
VVTTVTVDLPARGTRELRELAAQLNEARKTCEWTQRDLADRVYRDRSRVSRALSGRDLPARALVRDLARALGLDEPEVDPAGGESDRERR